MGSCATKSKKTQKTFAVLKIPEFVYVDRCASLVLSVSPSGSKRLPLTSSTVFLPKSLIGHQNEKSIYLLGGEKANKKQSKKCFHIDLSQNTVSRIQSLPKGLPSLSKAEILTDSTSLSVIPTDCFSIYFYSIKENTWTIINPQFNKSGLSLLRDYSCCKKGDSIIVISGRYSKTEYSNDIYCVKISQPDVAIFLFDLKFPGKLTNAKSVCTNDYKIVGAGYNQAGEVNTKFYIKSNKEDWNSVECPHFRVVENYSPFVVNNQPLFISGHFVMTCSLDVLVTFPIPGLDHDEKVVVANHDENTDKEASGTNDIKKQEKTESDEEAPVYSRSISDLSGSYVLKARILTPVNQTFRETISSYDSDFSSQRLYSDEENPEILDSHQEGSDLEQDKKELVKSQRNESTTRLNILHQKHSIEVLLNYETVQEFLLFLVDLFKIKNFRLPSQKPSKFSLYDLEGILRKLKFKLYPIETFKLIIKSLDILFAMKKSIQSDERNMLKKIAGIGKKADFVQKESLVNAVAFRIKLAVVGEDM